MPDIFDEIAPDVAEPKRDIFDEVAEDSSPKGDAFDQISEEPRSRIRVGDNGRVDFDAGHPFDALNEAVRSGHLSREEFEKRKADAERLQVQLDTSRSASRLTFPMSEATPLENFPEPIKDTPNWQPLPPRALGPDEPPFKIEAGTVLLNPYKFKEGVTSARKAGALDEATAEKLYRRWPIVQQAAERQRELEQKAGSHPELKAAASGAIKGGAGLLGGIAGGAATAAVAPESAFTSLLLVPTAAVTTGTLAHDATALALPESMKAASELYPGAEALGDLATLAVPAPVGLARGIRAANIVRESKGAMEATKFLAKPILAGSAGMAGYQGLESAVEGENKFDAGHIATGGALGLVFAGLPMRFRDYSAEQLASIWQRGGEAARRGINPTDVLSPLEREVYGEMVNRFDAVLRSGGNLDPDTFTMSATQAFAKTPKVSSPTEVVGAERTGESPIGATALRLSGVVPSGVRPDLPRAQMLADVAARAAAAGMNRTADAAKRAAEAEVAKGNAPSEAPPEAVTPTEPTEVPPTGGSPTPPAEEAGTPPTSEVPAVEPDPAAPEASEVVGVPAKQVPRNEIALRPQLMQFKAMLDPATGEAEHHQQTIGGAWDDVAAGNLLLWEPNDPTKYGLAPGEKYIVADGHGRVNYRDKNAPQVPGFNAQILREADGYSAQDALILAAEKNIKDGKGTIYDQTRFLRNQAASRGKDEAVARANEIGLRGRRAATIAFSAADPTYEAFINERITPEQAEAIAAAAPGDAALQAVGIKYALEDRDPGYVSNIVKRYRARLEEQKASGKTTIDAGQDLDLFGFDETAIRENERDAERVSEIQRELRKEIATLRAIKNVSKNRDFAKQHGVNVDDPEGIEAAVRKRIKELENELARWEGEWFLQPDLMAKLRGERAPESKPEEPPKKEEPPKPREPDIFDNLQPEKPKTEEKPLELMTPEEWVASGRKKGTQGTAMQAAQEAGRPINAALWDEVLGGVPHHKPTGEPYVRDGDVYRVRDLSRDPKDMTIAELAAKAHEHNEARENYGTLAPIRSHVGQFFDPKGESLQEAFRNPAKREAISKTQDANRELLRAKFGDSITVYRATDPFPRMTAGRTIFSWTLDRSIAERHAKGRDRRVIERQVPVDKVLYFGNEHEAEVLLNSLDLRALDGNPIPASLADAYGIKLPEGYTKQGDQYAKGEAPKPPVQPPMPEPPADDALQKSIAEIPDDTLVRVTMKDGRVLEGPLKRAQGNPFVQAKGDTIILSPVSPDFAAVASVEPLKTAAEVRAEKESRKYGEIAYTQPTSRDEYEATLWDLARKVQAIRGKGDQPGEHTLRELQLEAQFNRVADEIELAKSKRRYILATAAIRERTGQMPRKHELWSGLDVLEFDVPKPTDFSPDPAVRRARSPRPSADYETKAEIESSIRDAESKLNAARKPSYEKRAKWEAIIAKRKKQLERGEYYEAVLEREQKAKVAAEESSTDEGPQTLTLWQADRKVGDVKEGPKLGEFLTDSEQTANSLSDLKGEVRKVTVELWKPLVIPPKEDGFEFYDSAELNRILADAGVKFAFDESLGEEAWRYIDEGGKKLTAAVRKAGYDAIRFPEYLGGVEQTTTLLLDHTREGDHYRSNQTPAAPTAAPETAASPFAGIQKSDLHVAFYQTRDGQKYEILKDREGNLLIGPVHNAIDVTTGNRHARWEAPPHMATKWADDLLRQVEATGGKVERGERANAPKADLLAGTAEDVFNLAGEEGRDTVAEAEEKARIEAEKKAAKEKSDREQGNLFSPLPLEAPRTLPQRLDVQMEGEGNVSIPDVLRSYERLIEALGGNTPIRFRRFFERALGIYKPGAKVARIANAADLATAAHEIAHAIQDHVWHDTNSGVLRRDLPRAAVVELERLGQLLYGTRVPHNGYTSEGWAEFIRFYLTTDDVLTAAPNTTAWFESTFLPAHPELQEAMRAAKEVTDTWRREGALNRATAQMPRPESWFSRAGQAIRDAFSVRNWIEEFDSLKEIADEYQRITGRPLSPASNPYELASSKRGISGAVVMQMVDHGMVDPYGNPMRDASGRYIGSLREALAPVRDNEREFAAYLWARRAVHLHRRGIDPGMTRDDAQHILATIGAAHPEFDLAANNVYRWQDGVLEYLAIANPALRPVIDRIRNRSFDYVPLQRVISASEAKSLSHAMAANPLARIRGSGRPVRYIFDQILANTNKLVAAAHRAMVLDTIVNIAEGAEGMGYLIERVPRDPQRNEVDFEQVRRQLEDLGIDTSAVSPDDEVTLSYFTRATQPKGADPIVAVRRGNSVRWYQVNKELFDILEGLEPQRLHWLLSPLVWSAKAFRLGTTGIRASFSLITNPLRDAQTYVMQNLSTNNPARLAAAYLQVLFERGMSGTALNRLVGRSDADSIAMFRALGIEGAQPLGIDIDFTRKTARGLFNNALVRRVRSPIEALRELLSFTEAVPRIASIELAAREAGWTPGTPITPDQAVAIANAGKRVTVDFSAGGRIAKMLNQMIPFFNAVIQGTRSFGRTFRANPRAASLKALLYFVLPTLALWLLNRNKKWYQNLPWREKFLFWNFEHPNGKDVIQIPRPQEWGTIAALTEGAFDSWARKDPKAAEMAALHSLAITYPGDIRDNPILSTAEQQWRNHIKFWDRDIVPKRQLELPPGEQVSEYGSEIGKALGRAFPDKVSPRRVDAAVKSLFGGVGGDLINGADPLMKALGLAGKKPLREDEASDWLVIGRVFRRGGTSTQQNQAIADFYDEWEAFGTLSRSKMNPLRGAQLDYWKRLDGARQEIKVLQDVAEKTQSQVARQRLYESIADRANRVLKTKPKN